MPKREGLSSSVSMSDPSENDSSPTWLERIALALERLPPPPPPPPDMAGADAFVWHADRGALQPVPKVNRVDIALLRGVDRLGDALLGPPGRFSRGFPG